MVLPDFRILRTPAITLTERTTQGGRDSPRGKEFGSLISKYCTPNELLLYWVHHPRFAGALCYG